MPTAEDFFECDGEEFVRRQSLVATDWLLLVFERVIKRIKVIGLLHPFDVTVQYCVFVCGQKTDDGCGYA